MTQLIARVNGRDYEVFGGSVDWTLDAVGEFDFKIKASEIDYRNSIFRDVEIYSNNKLLTSGFIIKSPKLELKSDSVLLVQFKCYDELGRLTCTRAKANAHYQDTAVITILADLLASTTGWQLQTVNFIDPTIVTTIDLRNKETLFAQVTETVKATPYVHMRYGGIQGGNYILQVGNFNQLTEEAIQNYNLFELTLEFNSERQYRVVEAYGDLSADIKVNLADALADPRTTVHPDYINFPITQDPANGSWIVTNISIPAGCEVRKSFNVHKTRNDTTPTTQERIEAGYALWLKAVRFLQKSQPYESYSGSYISDGPPLVGDRIQVKSRVNEIVYDDATGQIIGLHPTFDVNQNYRITKVKHSLGETAILANTFGVDLSHHNEFYNFEATSNDESEQFDPDIELFQRLEGFDGFDSPTPDTPLPTVERTSLTLPSTPPLPPQLIPNCDSGSGGGIDGRLFVVPSPAVPPGATGVVTWYTVTPTTALLSNIVPPALPGNNWQACVRDPLGNWPPASPITIEVFWQFII